MSSRNERWFNPQKAPGDQYRHAICDVCGEKIWVKDGIAVQDKYNRQNGLFVCKRDADKINGQDIPYWVVEKPVDDPRTVRVRPTDLFAVNSASNRLPSAPQQLQATIESLSGQILLTWQGPVDTGSDGILGYSITRANPQLSTPIVISSNTNSPNTTYLDNADPKGFYEYNVAAVSSIGTGPYSASYFYPYENVNTNIAYLTANGGLILGTQLGYLSVSLGN